MAKVKLDLHDIYHRGDRIDAELQRVIDEAVEKKIDLVEIFPGKDSGKMKKRVLRFLEQKAVRQRYYRVVKDADNSGRMFVHVRH